jgi:mannose-1-phosphate guanylyltransferase
MILPIIMAGGSGSRLWPLSRTKYPKQFLSVTDEQTMLQQTLERMNGLEHHSPFVICNEEHRFLVAEQLRRVNASHSGILLEPVGRNTAPAVALAAQMTQGIGDDALMLVLAADHVIKDTESFHKAVEAAIPYAERGEMVTFGIGATSPETGYGYIRTGPSVSVEIKNACDGKEIESRGFTVDSFVEKPNVETAKQYLNSGSYLWNSGMFLFKASVYLEELAKFRPDIFEACTKAHESCFGDLDFTVMEKTDKAIVVPMNAEWSDVGSWSALWEVNDKDDNGNATRGDVLTEDTQDSFIYSQNKLVATVGVENLIVVETKDAVLVANKDKVQDVKAIVSRLKSAGRTEYLQHREVFRPWGSHDTVSEGDRYHVKQVHVKPKEKTALQMHYHRAEHWIVVSGTAKVTKGDETFLISENQSTYIPIGMPHAIENPGQVPLELIEVRSGSYLAEDDIVRFDEQTSKLGGDY